jgi:hypothetical protein
MRAPTLRVLFLLVLLPLAALNGGCAAAGLPLLLMLVKNDPVPASHPKPAES